MPESNCVPAPPPVSHAHCAPPLRIREVHKIYQKVPIASLPRDEFLLDFGGDGVSEYHKARLKTTGRIPRMRAEMVFRDFESGQKTQEGAWGEETPLEDDNLIYEHSSVPGNYFSLVSLYKVGAVSLHILCFRFLYNPLATSPFHSKIASPPSPVSRPLQPAA